jgi:PQQ-dependent dehydrogenase (methanol/ethanol family)
VAALGAVLILATIACTRGEREGPILNRVADSSRDTTKHVAGGMIADEQVEDGQWVRAAKDYASTRFSRLDQITTANVATLRVAFTFSTGLNRGHEAAPVVAGNTMYLVTPFPNTVYALDLTRAGAPVKWSYDPKPKPAAQGVACCDVVNRGVAYADGRVVLNTLDGSTIALDAKNGRELWRTTLANINLGESLTMAPLVVKGKVLVGVSGAEFGIRGWLAALDLSDGSLEWQAYHTGPDREALIGPRFRPFYASDRGADLGVKSWPGESWRIGGGGAWGWISYDPSLDLIYYGTANPGPWNADLRPGDNKWTAGIFARDPDDGAAVWFLQTSPHDLFDYDSVNEIILLDLTIGGRVRKVAVRPERNGFLYVVDRETGEVLSADPYGPITAYTGFDLAKGRPIENPAKHPKTGEVVREICPAAPGMKDWQPSAYSPRTGLLYIPHQLLCMDVESVEANYIAGTPYVGMNVKMYGANSGALGGRGDAKGAVEDPNAGMEPGIRGEFLAWDIVNRRASWSIKEDLPVWSGALVTAGDVAFYGTMDGWFKAVDARTGTVLWQFKCGSGIIGQPMTYTGPDGKQYVAVFSGVGGWAGAIVVGDLDARDSSSALGFANAVKDLPQKTTKGGMLYVFALP